MLYILLAFLATVIHLVSIFQELMVSTGFHSVLHQDVQSNFHADNTQFSLNTVIYMCLLLCQKAEICISSSLSFHDSKRVWYLSMSTYLAADF